MIWRDYASSGGDAVRRLHRAFGPEVLGVALFVALWQLGAALSDPLVLPSPLLTAKAMVGLIGEGALVRAAWVTTLRTVTGFGAAALLGVGVGILAGVFHLLRRMLRPIVTVLQGVPQIAWIVLALFWFGPSSGTTPVFTVAVAVLPLLFASAVEGMGATDRALLAMARAFRAPNRVLLLDLYWPHLLSYLFPAATAGLGIGWKVAVMAEVMSAGSGIGAGLQAARTNLQTPEAMAWILLVVLLMFGMEYLVLHPLRRRLEPWRQPEERGAGDAAA